MRRIPLVLAALILPLAGCAAPGEPGEGPFALMVTDAPDNIGDFSTLFVTVDRIVLTRADNGTEDLEPSNDTFDLTKLTNGNTTTLFHGTVAEGDYTRLDLFFSNATGTLVADNATVAVKAPSDRIFLNTAFTVSAGNETEFLFDIQVHKQGNDRYQFKPNADGSGPRGAR